MTYLLQTPFGGDARPVVAGRSPRVDDMTRELPTPAATHSPQSSREGWSSAPGSVRPQDRGRRAATRDGKPGRTEPLCRT